MEAWPILFRHFPPGPIDDSIGNVNTLPRLGSLGLILQPVTYGVLFNILPVTAFLLLPLLFHPSSPLTAFLLTQLLLGTEVSAKKKFHTAY